MFSTPSSEIANHLRTKHQWVIIFVDAKDIPNIATDSCIEEGVDFTISIDMLMLESRQGLQRLKAQLEEDGFKNVEVKYEGRRVKRDRIEATPGR